MHTLVEIVKNLLVIIILASFLELLLPSGAMKPYVRLAIGLFVLIAVLNPALRLLLPEDALHISSWEWSHDGDDQGEAMMRGSELHRNIIAAGSENMKSKLEGQIKAVALLVPGVDTVESTILLDQDGSVRKVMLQVSVRDETGAGESPINILDSLGERPEPDIEKRLAEILKNMFGLSPQQMEIKVQGGT